METAKDFGFNEGYTVDNGAEIPFGHTIVDSGTEKSLIVPTQLLDEDHAEYANSLSGRNLIPLDRFGKAYGTSKAVMNSVGISKYPNTGTVKTGVDFKGNPIYSNPQLANSTDTGTGKKFTDVTGIALGAMGAFRDQDEARSYMAVGERANNPDFHNELDSYKTNKDPHGFIKAIGSASPEITDYTGYKLYENWNSLSPAQKSIGIANTGAQGYKFSDGSTFDTKRLTPDIPGVPSLMAAQGLDLAGKGVNVSPATRHWNQIATIQDTFYTPKNASDVVTNANILGLLGHGPEGQAVPLTADTLSQSNAQLAPQYGVGAVTIPQGTGVPQGYTTVKDLKGVTVVIPTANRSTSVIDTPDVATKSAADIYTKWDAGDKPAKQDQGVIGGSALVGGLHQMSNTNPYSLGAVMTQTSFEHLGKPAPRDDLQSTTEMIGITLSRLLKGQANADVDKSGLVHGRPGALTEEAYNKSIKEMRGEFSRQGISSKEIGYQLANQGFSERRFNASQVTTLHKNLDMVFDDNSYVLAQKLNTGKNKGMEILERRNG